MEQLVKLPFWQPGVITFQLFSTLWTIQVWCGFDVVFCFKCGMARRNRLNNLYTLVFKCNYRCHKRFDSSYFYSNCSVWLGKWIVAKKLYLHLKHILYELNWAVWSLHVSKNGGSCLLGRHAMQSGRNLLVFQKNILPFSSG